MNPRLLELTKNLAEKGDHIAQLALGKLFLSGYEVQQNFEEAENWLKKSSDQGNRDAQVALLELNHRKAQKNPLAQEIPRPRPGNLKQFSLLALLLVLATAVALLFAGSTEPNRSRAPLEMPVAVPDKKPNNTFASNGLPKIGKNLGTTDSSEAIPKNVPEKALSPKTTRPHETTISSGPGPIPAATKSLPPLANIPAEPASLTSVAYISGDDVNLRKYPQITPTNIISLLKINHPVKIIEETRVGSETWVNIESEKTGKGWVRGDFVSDVPVFTGFFNTNKPMVFSSPDKNSAIIDYPKKSSAFVVLKTTNYWYQIRFRNGKVGWVKKIDIKLK